MRRKANTSREDISRISSKDSFPSNSLRRYATLDKVCCNCKGILTTPTPNPQTPKLLKPGAVNARPLAPAAPNTAQTIPTQTKQLWLKPQSSANENMFSKYDYIRTCIMYVHLYVRRYTVCICMCVHLCIHMYTHCSFGACVCIYIYICPHHLPQGLVSEAGTAARGSGRERRGAEY